MHLITICQCHTQTHTDTIYAIERPHTSSKSVVG